MTRNKLRYRLFFSEILKRIDLLLQSFFFGLGHTGRRNKNFAKKIIRVFEFISNIILCSRDILKNQRFKGGKKHCGRVIAPTS